MILKLKILNKFKIDLKLLSCYKIMEYLFTCFKCNQQKDFIGVL